MSKEKRYSDEYLNAFVDNQLAAEEKSQTYIEIGQNEPLNRQVCELRKLHDLVQLAYREPPAPPERASSGASTRRASWRFGVAASVLLTLGILLGSLIRLPAPVSAPRAASVPGHAQHHAVAAALHKVISKEIKLNQSAHKSEVTVTRAADQTPAASVTNTSSADLTLPTTTASVASGPLAAQSRSPGNAQTKVLIHLARDDDAQLGQALDDIEGMLKYYRETHQSARVEVVVNGGGLKLVRTDTSAFAGRIQHLQREYDNLTFAACQNTIDRIAREQGINVRLLPGVITIDSGMAEIMRRQHQGWTYLQV
jgi:intracellular sulfur oxidation DsrE/DsrF family protein